MAKGFRFGGFFPYFGAKKSDGSRTTVSLDGYVLGVRLKRFSVAFSEEIVKLEYSV